MNPLKFAVVTCFFLISPCYGEDKPFDFYIYFDVCKFLIGNMTLSDNTLQTQTGSTNLYRCKRESTKVYCTIESNVNKEKFSRVTYSVVRDSPPYLWLDLDDGRELITVNTAEGVAVVNSIILDEEYLASKICNGPYTTHSELEKLEELEFEAIEDLPAAP